MAIPWARLVEVEPTFGPDREAWCQIDSTTTWTRPTRDAIRRATRSCGASPTIWTSRLHGGEIAGYTRLGVYPNLGVTWWTTAIVGQDRSLVSSIDHHLPLATEPGASDRRVVAVGSNDLSVEYINRDPLRTMSVRGRTPARTHENATDIYADRAGSPTSLELDLTWRTDGVPYHYDVTTRYEIPCLVTGEIRVGGDVIPIDGQGQRDHSWGVRDWWAFGWCWAAARLDDGTRVHLAHIRLPDGPVALGYVQRDGAGRPGRWGGCPRVPRARGRADTSRGANRARWHPPRHRATLVRPGPAGRP